MYLIYERDGSYCLDVCRQPVNRTFIFLGVDYE
nr:MAG TPA: hypothetical protein [Caudoviricetes sp.]